MAKIDIMAAIAPKSDQLNADDLLAGPRTIRIAEVRDTGGAEQRIHIHFDGDGDRPWKPSKSALRVLVAIWGDDTDKWIGMHCTIYNDESVTWAGQAVGGIRIHAMEGLSKPRTLSLTKTRGKRAPTTIQPLSVATESKADKFRVRLFEIAEDPEASVEEAWAKVSEEMRAELGDGLYDQLIAIESAAQDHRENDPQAVVDALNDSLAD